MLLTGGSCFCRYKEITQWKATLFFWYWSHVVCLPLHWWSRVIQWAPDVPYQDTPQIVISAKDQIHYWTLTHTQTHTGWFPKWLVSDPYPDASCSQEVRSGPGNDSGFSMQIYRNARVMECHDPSIRQGLCRRTATTLKKKFNKLDVYPSAIHKSSTPLKEWILNRFISSDQFRNHL